MSGEAEKIIENLENKGFKLISIDSESLRGELEIDLYSQIRQIRRQLEEEGFIWSEEKESTVTD